MVGSQSTQYSHLFIDGVMPGHTIIYAQYNNGRRQCVLKQVVNTLNVHSNNVNNLNV